MSALLNRTMAVVAVLAACASLMVASPAAAQSGPRLAEAKTTTRAAVSSSWWNAVGSGSLRANPHTDYGNAGTFGAGDSMWLQCYFFGGPAGQYGNKLWYLAYDVNRNTYGWINDTNLNTPGCEPPAPDRPLLVAGAPLLEGEGLHQREHRAGRKRPSGLRWSPPGPDRFRWMIALAWSPELPGEQLVVLIDGRQAVAGVRWQRADPGAVGMLEPAAEQPDGVGRG
ncbi:hypothetical protein [Micromonospora sp. NPDC049645]|uniref:hypothetical protein n=1 Tax=Micromonospora sp. NPDC049645 TaxID=3155508 RepID=UPI0034493749